MNRGLTCRVALGAIALGVSGAAIAADFGATVDSMLARHSRAEFGFGKPTTAADVGDNGIARENETAQQRQDLARGLTARYVARNVAQLADMISFWPDDINYTHLIVCIEQGRSGTTPGGNSGYNAAVQRVDVATGAVATILHGMSRCDGIRTTQWGTVLATEETDDGGVYEILDPLNTTHHWIADRGAAGAAADIRDGIDSLTASTKVVKRTALVTQAWEGLDTLENGVVIGGDEQRSGDAVADVDEGGAVYRFVPAASYNCGSPTPVRPGQLCQNLITGLALSPLIAGDNFALATVCTGNTNLGQGCEYGDEGRWVEITNPADARNEAAAQGATGYCRPEDLHIDRGSPMFTGGDGIKWCWTNTCGGARGEALCATESNADVSADQLVAIDVDGTANVDNRNFLTKVAGSNSSADRARVNVTRFVENDARMRSHDNLDFQPGTGNVYVIEDDTFGEIWACLPDGTDRDLRSDGCVSMLTINDPSAEPTGFIFDGTGKVAFYNMQHGQQPAALLDTTSNPIDGTTDELIKITGWKKVPNDDG
ncbi:MAG: alkaline phosphatase PhoX [Burkholderiales bacterium]